MAQQRPVFAFPAIGGLGKILAWIGFIICLVLIVIVFLAHIPVAGITALVLFLFALAFLAIILL